MTSSLIIGNARKGQKNLATFLDQTSMFDETYFCMNLQEMADLLPKRPVDVIFTQDSSSHFKISELFSILGKKEEWNDIPVFLFAQETTPEQRVLTLGMGAADCLDCKTSPKEISALAQLHIQKKQRIEKLRHSRESFYKQATTDPLTGLHTWEHFENLLNQKEKSKNADFSRLAIVVIRPDHLDSIGETLGQSFSKKVLKMMGETLTRICRRGDPLCRLNDHSFGLLLPNVTEQQAFVAAERIRKKIAGQPMDYPVTVSMGVRAFNGLKGTSPRKIADEAYLALKASSKKGINRVEMFRAPSPNLKQTVVQLQPETRPISKPHQAPAYASL